MEIQELDFPSPRTWECVRRKNPCPQYGGDITPIRLRLRLHFFPRRRGEVRAHHESGLSRLSRAASHLPLLLRFFTNHGFYAFHDSQPFWPFGSPWVRKGRTTKNRRLDRRERSPVTASLLTSAHYCSRLLGTKILSGASVPASSADVGGLATSAVRRSPRRFPASLGCGERTMNPCRERGTFYFALTTACPNLRAR